MATGSRWPPGRLRLSRGRRYTAADLSLTDPAHPTHAETRAHRDRLHELFTSELQALGNPNPGRAADQLLLLIDGVLVGAITRPETHPAAAAREMAENVLDGAAPPGFIPPRPAPATPRR